MHTHLHAPLQYTDDRGHRARQIDAAAAHEADTIGWTEVQRPDQVSRIRLLPGYDTWWPSGRAEVRPLNYCPISWRTDRFRLRGHEHRKASDGLSGEFPDKHFTAVVLEDLETGEVVRRVQAHMVPGIQSLGDETPAVRRATVAAHASNVKVFRSLCLAGDRPTIGTCDANTTDFPAAVRNSGLLVTGVGATHGHRAIDWAVSLGYRITAKRAVRIGPSDHRGILLTATTTTAPEEAPSMLPADLPEILRDAGLRVVELDGWRTRGRPGPFTPVGVLCHHTASSADGIAGTHILVQGRPDLPGPLSQLGLSRDGTVYIVAAGRSNHAGTAKASGTVAAGDGNTLYIGIEAMNRGTGERWPRAQYDAYVTLAAVLSTRVTGNSVNTVRAHKETSVTGKIDPFGPTPYGDHFDMDDFRARVGAAMSNPRPTTEEDIDMTPEEFQNLVRTTPLKLNDGKWGATLEEALNHIENAQDAINQRLKAQDDPEAFAAAVVALLGGSADYETVKRAVKDALSEGTATTEENS